MSGMTVLSLTCAWCGGMSVMIALVHWRDNESWWLDAVYACVGLSLAILYGTP